MKLNTAIAMVFILLSINVQARTVVDQNHIQVTIPDTVSRIVTIPIPMASMIMTIDEGSQRVVAVNRSSHNDFTEGFLAEIYPQVVKIPYDIASDGFVPNVETLVKLHPDVVIQWGDRGDAIVKPIKDAGLPVLTTIYGETRYVSDWMRMAGNLLNKSTRGNQLADWFDDNYQSLLNNTKDIAENNKPKVIYLYRYTSGLVVAGKGSSYQGDITLAGGINLAGELSGFAPVNIEQLLIWNPDIILLNNFEGNLTPEILYQDNRLRHLSAIKNKQVYVYPRGGFRWDPPSQESILSLTWLSLLFHPQQYHAQQKNSDFRQQMKQTYQLLYNYKLTDEQIDRILRIKDNMDSVNYCKLFCVNE